MRGEVPLGVPGRGWYVVAAGAVVAGLLIAIALVAWAIFGSEDRAQFTAPGTASVQLQPGKHAIWNDYRTTFDATAYDSPREIPESLKIVVKSPTGTPLPLQDASRHELKTRVTDRDALKSFIVVSPGVHEVAASGDFPKRVLSIAPYGFWRSFGAMLAAVVAAVLGLVAGFGIWTWAFFRRDAAAEAASPRPAMASPADASLRRLTAAVYALQLAGYFTLMLSPIAGLLINYLKRGAAAGTWLESHFRYQIRTFWITLAGLAAGVATLLLLVGYFILGVTLMWFLYRGIKGWMELSDGKPMYL